MALIIQSITNLRLVPIHIFIPGFDATQAPVTVAPSATLDLLSVITEDTLLAIQDQLNHLVSNGTVSVSASIDTASFEASYTGASGSVAAGTAHQLAYYSATGSSVSGLTAITGHKAVASDANGLPVASATTDTELGYVSGVTSAIQTQLNAKAVAATTPAIAATVDLIAVAADATAPILTPAVSGMFLVSVYAVCTASATGGDAAPNLNITWTDESGFNQNFFATPLGANATLINYGSFPVYDVATNPISYVIAGGVYATTLRYNIHFVVEKI